MFVGFLSVPYQLALRTPGMIPPSARLRKQIRQIPNFRYTARARPQSRQRWTRRVENFGFRSAMAIFDLLAIGVYTLWGLRCRKPSFQEKNRALVYVCGFFSARSLRAPPKTAAHAVRSGIPSLRSNSRDSAYPGASRPYSLAVTRARATNCRQRNALRVEANSSTAVR